MTHQPAGEPLVPGVRVVRLPEDCSLRVHIGRGVEATDADLESRIETEWNRKRAINPRLFDGPNLSVRSIDAQTAAIDCVFDTYKRLVVQPEVETGVRQLSITGVLTAQDAAGVQRVLLGRRSHKTRMYGGMWQNCPAGGIDPDVNATSIDQSGLMDQLLREVKEESGLEPRSAASPIAVIFDETARSHDIIVPIDLGTLNLATTRGWEYDELRWVPTASLAEFECTSVAGIMAITRAIFRLRGWIPNPEAAYDLYLQGLGLLKDGQPRAALADLYTSMAAQPGAPAARRITEALTTLGDIAAADRWALTAFELAPENDLIAARYAESLIRAGKGVQARQVLDTVLARNPTYLTARRLRDLGSA